MTEPHPITGWVIVDPDGAIVTWTFDEDRGDCIDSFTHGVGDGPKWHPFEHYQRQGYRCCPAKLEVTA